MQNQIEKKINIDLECSDLQAHFDNWHSATFFSPCLSVSVSQINVHLYSTESETIISKNFFHMPGMKGLFELCGI